MSEQRFFLMSRAMRIVIPGLAHHIIVRGNNRRTLFSYPREYLRFIAHIGKALEAGQCLLHAMTMMRNHVHCIVTPTHQNDLSIFVKAFSQRYAMYRNRRRGGSGKLFQQRYISKPIQDEAYLAVAHVYVELNAWRAGMVDDPLDYKWSTYPIHAGHPTRSKIPVEFWTPSPWYLGLGKSEEARASRYRDLARQFYSGGSRPTLDDEIDGIEELSEQWYQQRLERPDRSSAR